jgi:two-component system cell cycle sensor histidine kinase/response regulator CckA
MSMSQRLRLLSDCEFLVKAIQGVVWEADPKTVRFTFVSEQARLILGYPNEMWLEENFWVNHLHPVDRAAAIEACSRATSMGKDHEFEYRMIHSDGHAVWFRDSVFVDMQDGKPVRLRGILIDISEQMQLQSAIKESEQLLRLIASSAKDAIFRKRIHPVPQYEYISPAVFDMTGYSAEEFYEDSDLVSRIIHPDDRWEQGTRAFVEPSGDAVTLRIIRKNGGTTWLELRSVTIYDDAGLPTAIEGIARDITERRELLEQLNQSQKIESPGQAVRAAVHELNNLLTVVLGNVSLAMNSVNSNDPICDNLESISSATERVTELTRKLLGVSHSNEAPPAALDLNNVAREMKEMLLQLIGPQVDMSFQLGADLGPIRPDSGQIWQILLNLVVNARDAMPDGGKLAIRTSSFVTRYEVSFRKTKLQPGAYTVLSVTDTGTGIDPMAREHIFKPFFSTKPSASGMGLTTVQSIVSQCNGAIVVESTMQEGTTFRIYFPVIEEPRASSSAKMSPIRHRSGETVVVVEDDDFVREVVSGVLESSGYHVMAAKTSAEALAVLNNYPGIVDLFLIDMFLPDINGRELGDRLASIDRRVVISYMSGRSDEVLSLIEGIEMNGLLHKPFTMTALLDRVRRSLDSRS